MATKKQKPRPRPKPRPMPQFGGDAMVTPVRSGPVTRYEP